eukprot:6453566-Lingulodinium_polyedra.AAC.1
MKTCGVVQRPLGKCVYIFYVFAKVAGENHRDLEHLACMWTILVCGVRGVGVEGHRSLRQH